nr:MAG TPA: hypothetical protein [Caudoviricetes sp.]
MSLLLNLRLLFHCEHFLFHKEIVLCELYYVSLYSLKV